MAGLQDYSETTQLHKLDLFTAPVNK